NAIDNVENADWIIRRRIRINSTITWTTEILDVPSNRGGINVASIQLLRRNKFHQLCDNSAAPTAPIQNIVPIPNWFVLSHASQNQSGSLSCHMYEPFAPTDSVLKLRR